MLEGVNVRIESLGPFHMITQCSFFKSGPKAGKWLICPQYQCADPNFWTKTDKESVLVAKLAYSVCSITLLLGWSLKRIVWAPDQRLWKCRNSRQKPKRDRNGHFSFLKGSGGKFQVRRLIFALNVLYYTPTHLGEVPHLNSNLTHYLYTLL